MGVPVILCLRPSATLRAMAVTSQLGTEAALEAAPCQDGSFFVVPRIIAHDKEVG